MSVEMDAAAPVLLFLVSLSLLADLFLIFFFILLPELRKGPGELILLQTQAQLLPDLHWLSVSYVLPNKNTALCDVVASFNNFGLALAPAYSAAICVAACRYTDSPKTQSYWWYHLVLIPLSAGVSLTIYFTKGAGKSTFGTCSLEKGSWAE